MNNAFLSDNASPADERIVKAAADANTGFAMPYGNDPWTEETIRLLKVEFGEDIVCFPVMTGTGANIVSLASALRPHQSVLCPLTAHINVDECGAPERFTGSKLVPIPTPNGKLTPELIKPYLAGKGFEHHSQPGLISISQVTELGTVYCEHELKELSDFAKANDLIIHMDGSRISNAAAYLGISLKEAATGADILSFGGTKNGLMIGEVIVFLNPALSEYTKYFRKQYGQLTSKMRYITSQFIPYLKERIWHENALKSNKMASVLAEGLLLKGVKIAYPVNSNAVFAVLSEKQIEKLSENVGFYVWDERKGIVRFMCAYCTSAEDVQLLLDNIC